MPKSKDKEVDLSLRQIYEGQLSKYTNMVTGWQNRWFVLDPHTGMLEYYMAESERRQKPRGSMHLAGAMIVPSEEGNSYTFSVNAANGECFKLRATDAKERQYWINRLRVVAQAHYQVLAESNPPLLRDPAQLGSTISSSSLASNTQSPQPTQKILTCNLTVLDAFSSVRDYLRRVECEHQRVVHSIEDMPSSGSGIMNIDTELLLLKATSQATVLCLEQCLAILHYQQQQPSRIQQMKVNSAGSSPLLVRGAATPAQSFRIRSDSATSALSDQPATVESSTQWYAPSLVPKASSIAPPAKPDDEGKYVEDDTEAQRIKETGLEEHKSRTLLLLSQLKLGTELTKTSLPVFFCENRSLLQVCADAFRQPELLIKITNETVAEQRMAKVLHWYFECFRSCQLEMSAARKPFNPVLGENFKCVWNVKEDNSDELLIFRFQAEQVSHNPPITAFHLECPGKVKVQGHLLIKAKFMGMYVGTTLSGDFALELEGLGEKYELGYPSLYVRSILSEPWMEFGGKVNCNCPETRLSAGVVFHTKPFYGGKPHHVTGEIKNSNGNVVCKLSGDWNTQLDVNWANGRSEIFELNGPWSTKKVRPLDWQHDKESIKLWHPVAQSLAQGDFQAAADHKKLIEEQQREEERICEASSVTFTPVYFQRENETWVFKK